MRSLALAVLAAVLAAQPAFAALHKCTTKEGKVVYTEFECEKDAAKADVTIRDSSGVDGTKAASPARPAGAKAPPGAPPAAPGKAPPAAPDKDKPAAK